MSQYPTPNLPPQAPQGTTDPAASPAQEASSDSFGTTAWMWGIVLLILVAFAVFYSSPSGAEASFQWVSDLEDGLATAQAQNQLVLVAFKTSGCGACVHMDREVLSKEPVGRALSDWVAVRINPSYEPRVSARYNIQAVPTFVILTPEGGMLDSFVGTMDVASFVGRLDRAESRWRERTGTEVADAR